MKIKKYTFWRLIAAFCVMFVIVSYSCCYFAIRPEEKVYYLYACIPVALFLIYSAIHFMRFPLDLRLYIVWVFIFSYMSVAYGSTGFGILLGFCAFILANIIGSFNTRKKLKLVIIFVFYAVSVAFIFRLEGREFITAISELLCASVAVTLMYIVLAHLIKRINSDFLEKNTTEDINEYFAESTFSDRDKEMLMEVLSGCKYEEIAINHKLSLSSVKKRLAFLYKKLGVSCQIDFIIKFSQKTGN